MQPMYSRSMIDQNKLQQQQLQQHQQQQHAFLNRPSLRFMNVIYRGVKI